MRATTVKRGACSKYAQRGGLIGKWATGDLYNVSMAILVYNNLYAFVVAHLNVHKSSCGARSSFRFEINN